tara:strand:- start:451 stop:798 length:348 start_codon:yes stop_codon:yes gene_type:complete
MKKFNKNKMRRDHRGPGSQLPIKHNQKKPFNPKRYGELWNTIHFDLRYGNQTPLGDCTQPTMGWIHIGGKRFEITWTEANKIMETLNDMQNVYAKAKRMNVIHDAKHKIERSGVY